MRAVTADAASPGSHRTALRRLQRRDRPLPPRRLAGRTRVVAAHTRRPSPAPIRLASQAGQEILAAGGNAFDAAVAVSAALAVVEPTSSGLGGGGFYLLHRQADGFETMLDAREKAPGAASRDMYLDKAGNAIESASIDGPLASAIPGEPAAFELSGAQVRQAAPEAKPAAGDSPGARGLSAVCASARGHSLQARDAAALARCGQGIS